MSILYKNIKNGKEVSISADTYEEQLAEPDKFEKDFFSAYEDIISKYERSVYKNGTILYTVYYKTLNKPVCILWGPLKNSGTKGKEDKRIQVLPKVELKDETPYFAIGAYNTLDSNLYCVIIGGIREFIKHAQTGKAFSSLWFDYSGLWSVYNKGTSKWTDRIKRTAIGCKSPDLKLLHKHIMDAVSHGNLDKESSDNIITEPKKEDIPFIDFSSEITKYQIEDNLPRNPLFREIALEREKFTCELCGTDKTFSDRNNKEYFEGHHLIPYNVTTQKRFKYCLDHPDNIICLCPKCHREIHHSAENQTKDLILRLFTKHNDLLKKYNIKKGDLVNIIKDYNQN